MARRRTRQGSAGRAASRRHVEPGLCEPCGDSQGFPADRVLQDAAVWPGAALAKEVQDVLRADDTLSRDYVNLAATAKASLLIAFFKTQRYGQAPHSPKNCLPGAGWEPTESGTIRIAVPEWQEPIVVNRYVVAHGEDKVLAIYWYQGRHRVIASEYW